MSIVAGQAYKIASGCQDDSKDILREQRQTTIAGVAVVEGFGYWGGKDVRVEFHPAEVNTGLVFIRDDLPTPAKIPATVEYRIETPRRTSLVCDGTMVEMIEHVMAALYGLGICNCEVHVNQSEMPGCDGSSATFVNALDAVGIVAQNISKSRLVIHDTTRVGDKDHWIEARPSKDGKTSLRYRLDYTNISPAIGRQTAEFVITPDIFRQEIARCRTFMLEPEAQWLLSQGLGTRVQLTDVLVFDQQGLKENTLRFEDECARHKILDMVGDFALAGCDIVGHIIAHRTGHRLNAELIKALLKEGQLEEFHH